MAQQDEGRQDRRSLVEDVAAAGQRHGDGVQPPGPYRDGDQHHHVEGAGSQRLIRPHEEDRAGVEDHRQAQQERPHVVAQAERRLDLEAQDVTSDRRPQQDRNREQGSHEEAPPHCHDHVVHRHRAVLAFHRPARRRSRLVGRSHRVAHVRRHRLPVAFVATTANALAQLPQRDPRGRVRDGRRLGHRVRLHSGHPGTTAERRLDHRLLTRSVQAARIEDERDEFLRTTRPIGVGVVRHRCSWSLRPRSFYRSRRRVAISVAVAIDLRPWMSPPSPGRVRSLPGRWAPFRRGGSTSSTARTTTTRRSWNARRSGDAWRVKLSRTLLAEERHET